MPQIRFRQPKWRWCALAMRPICRPPPNWCAACARQAERPSTRACVALPGRASAAHAPRAQARKRSPWRWRRRAEIRSCAVRAASPRRRNSAGHGTRHARRHCRPGQAKRARAILATQLENNVHLVSLERGRIQFRPNDTAPKTMAGDLAQRLREWTGERWIVTLASEGGAPTLTEQKRAATRQEGRRLPGTLRARCARRFSGRGNRCGARARSPDEPLSPSRRPCWRKTKQRMMKKTRERRRRIDGYRRNHAPGARDAIQGRRTAARHGWRRSARPIGRWAGDGHLARAH